ncbi:MAG: ATP-binding cassette domain-containing protein [Alphaproteobacteria bacterium]|nr:ATP-binding cassette domain-containing protein [Alphaproteobacteria bacterium]MBU1280444.1 ATP-binding cassette domain-containing protein [Alphaproteobacteria bacterium]MBU1572272.1 ATP-binding cassette domain-containing protein [Alphaproteobacteria bacterium]MBU1829098.1 ATP-binding cassette domain-containing protein [Alphaproteobacteria bacterium]MBU2078474.1 ATP-binding cassette domain-containing protein [Alphaproteobacteria bacterium]
MTALLKIDGLRKRFGGNEAVKNVSFEVNPGECVVLAGDNGAGKSTVIKMISGVYQPTDGKVYMNGALLTGKTPEAVRTAGIETIYQDLALADNLDPGLNLYLGREAVKHVLGFPYLDRKKMREDAAKVMLSLGIVVPDPTAPVREMSGGQRQAIAIARAIHWQAGIVIMDEPTAALGVPEQREVMALIERLKKQGVGIILISHNLPDIFAAADRIIVLARGVVAGERRPAETNDEEIVRMMMGATL